MASRPPIPLRARLIAALVFLFVVVVTGGGTFARFYTDLLWFRDMAQADVFWTRIWSEMAVGAAFGVTAFLIVYTNLVIARRIRPAAAPASRFAEGVAMTPPQQLEEFLARVRGGLEPYVGWVLLVGAILLSWGIGRSMGGEWELFRLALSAPRFGYVDPQFGLDAGFFVFTLPALRVASDWLFDTLTLALALSVVVHLYDGGIRPAEQWRGFDPHVKAHVSVLLGLIIASKALDYRLSIWELNLSPRGQVIGASFTDVNAQIPAYWILIAVAVVTGVLLIVNIRYRGWRLPLVALGVWIGAGVLVGAIYPALVQQLQVAPNELAAERPYIERNIEMTRRAWDLDTVDATGFPATYDLTAGDLVDATTTVRNVRLWDPAVVVESYKQLQEIRFYYDFNDVDIDRYVIDGQLQQVLVSAREMNVEQLSEQSRTWINKHLVYTHGYGVVVSPVNRATTDGLPAFLVKDLPPKSTASELDVKVPGIYFGEETRQYAIVGTTQKEFDYPVGGENATAAYTGRTGIPVGSLAHRVAFALLTGDVEILFSSAITGDSRILWRRTLTERVDALAPWLLLDDDPYPVIVKGRVLWVLDGYTWSSMHPYSERYGQGRVNYMRNSVKVTIDAYDGTTTFYAFDEKDPVLGAYRALYPGLFVSGSTMPAEVAAHLRYPETMFRAQAEIYKTYHMLDPQVFYNKEDQWALPGENTDAPMVPYYVLMQLPGQSHEDFLLMQPFTPRNKDNMIGWMAAKSDPGTYGERVVYNFPKQRLILGPQQVRARLNQEPEISKELTLLNQQGSQVRFGNLLVLPIKDSIVYVEPLYIQAAQSPMPELKRVIVAYSDKVAMDSDLKGALLKVFGGAPEGSETTTGAPGGSGSGAGGGPAQAGDAARARDLYEKALAAQRAGDWAAYGRLIAELGSVLQRLATPSAPATAAP